MQPVPIGIAGEINIGGAGVARGYLNRPALTAERFVANPFSADPQARMYKTGDLGRWRSDGTIEYLGRNDRQVKIRGFRVELGEIEAQLVRLAQVKEVTLIAREDLPGEKRLVAYIVYRELAKGENAPDVQSLRTHLRASLPEYAVPSAFVVMERLPITPNGKLDLRALPTPELEAYGNQQYDAPQGEVEELLAAIWQPLLAVSRVGRQDNFFDLGGHSLIATRVISRLREVFQLELPLKALFDAPTVTQLSLRVETERRALSAQEPLHMSKHRRRDVKEMNEEEVVAEIAKLQKELSAGTLRQSRP
jgi:acyl carrier protein